MKRKHYISVLKCNTVSQELSLVSKDTDIKKPYSPVTVIVSRKVNLKA